MYKGSIPYNRKGDALNYPQEEYEWEYGGVQYASWYEIERQFGTDASRKANRITVGPIWKPNEVFEANLAIESISRGRSAAHFDVKNMQTGAKYTMFLTDFLNLLKKHTLDRGETPRLKWQFTKRGANFGVMLAELA